MWKWLTDQYTKAKAAIVNTWHHIEPGLEANAEAFGAALFQIAVGAVTKQIPLILSGSLKFDAAVADVIKTAEAQAIAVAKPMAQKAVQDAYTAMLAANGATLIAAIPSDPDKALDVAAAIKAANDPITAAPTVLPSSGS